MKPEILDIEDVYGSNNIETKIMKALTERALFDEEEVRQAAVESLKKRYQGIVKGGFEKDGIMFLYIQYQDSKVKILDVGPAEIKYCDKSVPFKI